MSVRVTGKQAAAALRTFALAFPESHEDFPWGERVVKVRGKVFVFLGHDPELGSGPDPHGGGPGGGFGLSVKLPSSGMVALSLSFARPTGYGLGRAGWVSAEFGPKEDIPLPMLRDWIAESYRAVAPKTLVRQLEAAGAGATPAARPRRRSAGAPAPRERRRRIGS